MVKQSVSTLQGSALKSSGAASPAIPHPASSTTLNGLMIDGSMKPSTCLTYPSSIVRDVRPPGAAAGAGIRLPAIMSRISEMPASPLSG